MPSKPASSPLPSLRSFRLRLFVLMVVLLAGVIGLAILVALTFQQIQNQTVAVEVRSGQAIRQAREVQAAFQDRQVAWLIYRLRRSEGFSTDAAVARLQRAEQALATALRAVEGAGRAIYAKEVGPALEALFAADAELRRAWSANIAQLNSTGAPSVDSADTLARADQAFSNALDAVIRQTRQGQDSRMTALEQNLERRMTILVLVALATLLGASLAVFWYLDRQFNVPMSRAIDAAVGVSDGELEQRIEVDRRDEFGVFATAFNTMLERLAEATGSVEKANEELARANADLEAYSYTISHDLRAPLRAITGFCQILREDARPRLEADDLAMLTRIETNAKRMSGMVEELLELARLEQSELEIQDVDLTVLARQSIDVLRIAEPERRVSVNVADGLKVRGDPRLLQVVVDNLLGNAWKYSARQDIAEVEFGRESTTEGQHFYVRDNGCGFDMTHSHRLFRPFQRLHGAAEYEGSGVGLAAVERALRRHGGRIWIESQLDLGTTVRFTL